MTKNIEESLAELRNLRELSEARAEHFDPNNTDWHAREADLAHLAKPRKGESRVNFLKRAHAADKHGESRRTFWIEPEHLDPNNTSWHSRAFVPAGMDPGPHKGEARRDFSKRADEFEAQQWRAKAPERAQQEVEHKAQLKKQRAQIQPIWQAHRLDWKAHPEGGKVAQTPHGSYHLKPGMTNYSQNMVRVNYYPKNGGLIRVVGAHQTDNHGTSTMRAAQAVAELHHAGKTLGHSMPRICPHCGERANG